jgi:hypothetical protein
MHLRRLIPLASLLAVACDVAPPSGPIPVHPVTGAVTYKGKPVPGELVAFHPVAVPTPSKPGEAAPPGTPRPTGKTDSDGKFRLHTYVGEDGAPVGEYKVTIAYAGSAETRNVMAKDTSKALNVTLPPKYADPAKSDLSATVKDGANAIPPFDLK